MDANPHAHEAENEQGPPRFATGGNATQLRRRSQYNMPPQLHRLAMQPQTESASNLLFGGPYGSPGIPSLRGLGNKKWQRKQRRRRLVTASNAMRRRLPARGIGPGTVTGTGRQGPWQRGVGGASSRRQWPKWLRAWKGGAGASGQQQRRLGGGGKRGWVT